MEEVEQEETLSIEDAKEYYATSEKD